MHLVSGTRVYMCREGAAEIERGGRDTCAEKRVSHTILRDHVYIKAPGATERTLEIFK